MPLITFLPSGKTYDASPGTLLSDAARDAGVTIDLPCGGKGVCGRCHVRVVSGSGGLTAKPEGQLLVPSGDGIVLACHTKVGNTPVEIEIGEGYGKGQFSSFTDDIQAVEPALLPSGKPSPMVTQLTLTVPEPKLLDGLSDLDRLKRTVTAVVPCADIELPLGILADLPRILRQHEGCITLNYWLQNEILRVVSTIDDERPSYGLAVDVGTTTAAAHLVSLDTGAIVSSMTEYNAQISCGLDIISRIHYARGSAERLLELKIKILDTLNTLINRMSAGISTDSIVSVSLAGNTTMIHLLMGIIPEYIRLHPYAPCVYDTPVYTAHELGLNVCGNAPVFIAPSVGSYVGGDITAGLLCTRLSDAASETGPMLFIDIGTNGEIVLGNSDFLLGCACSAGPAFEGGGIRHGCRASSGAIERVELNGNGEVAACTVIGGVAPTGICGSGAISLASELFKNGLVDAAGRFTDKAPLTEDDGRKCFVVSEAGGKLITFSETDMDNLLRAKAAVFSACQTLLSTVGLGFDDLERVYVAGGFGRFLDMDCASSIGLLPHISGGRSVFLGNSSLTGAYMALLSCRHRHALKDTASRITYIDLSSEPGYMDEYMAALFIPHTTLSFE